MWAIVRRETRETQHVRRISVNGAVDYIFDVPLSAAAEMRSWRAALDYQCGCDENVHSDHAEQLRERFGGEILEPKDLPKWPGIER